MSDVFFNGILSGNVDDAQKFVESVKQARREGRLSRHLNIRYDEKQTAIYIALDRNRVTRPLVVVKNGISMLTKDKLDTLKNRNVTWNELVDQGVIEYVDAMEEEDSLVALDENELSDKHTHMEINPVTIFGICTSMVPYANFNQSSRLNRGQKTQKQAMGCYTLNYLNRMDTALDLLHYPQTPLVRSFSQSMIGEERAAGQNVVIAIINYDGYNMSDALVLNEDGIIYPEAVIGGGDVLIGKASPPRFLGKLEAFSTAANIRKDTSVRTRYGEDGIISKVVITENEDGSSLIKVDVRDSRCPEIGDKFSSRHGQKGIVGAIVPPQDLPFTASGIVPDVVFSPNGLPKRMTVSQLIEALGGKVGALGGRTIEGTAFQSEDSKSLREQLLELGFRDDGTETMYDGRTGRQYTAKIFVGNMYYLRLKHQVADKIQARARGPVTLLTRQPTEGKAKEGGLRLGEMEKDSFVAHGASLLMKERFDSDKAIIWICGKCGDSAVHDAYRNKAYCLCGEKVNIHPIEMSYAFKLFLDELKSLHLKPKLGLGDVY